MGNSFFCSEIGQPRFCVHKFIKGGIKPKKAIKSVALHEKRTAGELCLFMESSLDVTIG